MLCIFNKNQEKTELAKVHPRFNRHIELIISNTQNSQIILINRLVRHLFITACIYVINQYPET